MLKRVLAPYVREARLPDLETSIKVADQGLVFFQSLQRQIHAEVDPGACVALSLYQMELDTEERISCIAKMSGKTLQGFLKSVSETRSLLNLPFAISFDQLAQGARLPVRLACTARKVFSDLQAEFPDDSRVSRAAIYAAVMLVVAVKRGFKKEQTLADLSRITSSDPDDVLKCEQMIRHCLGRKHGFRVPHTPEDGSREASEELKEAAARMIQQLKEEARAPKKKVQQKLSFPLVPRRETD